MGAPPLDTRVLWKTLWMLRPDLEIRQAPAGGGELAVPFWTS